MKTHDYITLYISETNEIIQGLEEEIMRLETDGDSKDSIDEMFRHAHNLKGMSGAMGFDLIVEASHALENILDGCRKGTVSIGKAEIDLLLRVADALGALVEWTVKGSDGGRGKDLLAEILVLLSPMNIRLADVAARNQDAGVEQGGKCEQAGLDAGKETPMDDEIDDAGPDNVFDTVEELTRPEEPSEDTAGGDASAQEVAGTGLKVRSPMNRGISSTKVDLERLDCLMDLVGELIISRIRLSSLAKEIGSRTLSEELASSGRLISEIQKEVMEARLIPAGQIFHRFKRLARDTSRELGKEIDFRVEGADIGLDRTVLESMIDPLVHMIRNAIDHGVETPQERKATGKSPKAEVVLSARRERNHVILEVRDDGRGIDLQKVNEVRGDDKETRNLTSGELCRIITEAGFSTREKVSRYSGRGIGMNVVKETVDSLGGSLDIESTPGEGTSITMFLPINLSIIKALLFYIGSDIHAIPIEFVKETVRVERGSFETVRGREVYKTEQGPIPVIRPADVFGMDMDDPMARFIKVIIVEAGRGKACLVVNRILGQQDVVIKSLPSMIRGIGGISGATILGSGKIAFIWDPKVLFHGRSTYESDKEAVVLEN